MKLYKGFWWNYCTKNYNLEYRRVLLELLEEDRMAEYLDIGCGDGELTLRCSEKINARKTFGMDISNERLWEATERGVITFNGYADKTWNLGNSMFDVITANQVIEHLDDTDKFIKEVLRVLKPGGYAIISTNNLASFHWIVMFILGIQPPTACPSDEMCAKDFNSPYNGEKLHRRLFMIPGLTRVLRYYGFIIEKVVGTYWLPFPKWFARILCWLDPVHSSCITVKIRKPPILLDEAYLWNLNSKKAMEAMNLMYKLHPEWINKARIDKSITKGNNYD